jgi:hypothetical protein
VRVLPPRRRLERAAALLLAERARIRTTAVDESGGIEPLGLFTTTPVFGTGCRPFGSTLDGNGGDRRGLNPHLLVHSEACTPVHHGHHARRASSPSWNRTSVTGFKGRLTATDRGMRLTSVGAEGIEPPSAVCRTTALPLDEAPVGAAGVEPAISCSRNRRLPIKPSRREIVPIVRESPGNRTLFVRVRAGCFASKAWDSCGGLPVVRAAGGARTHSGRFKRPVPGPVGRQRRRVRRVVCTAQESNLASQRRGVYSAPRVPALGAEIPARPLAASGPGCCLRVGISVTDRA